MHYGLIHSSKYSMFNSCDAPFINKDNIPKKYTIYKSGDLILADTSEDKKDVGKPLELILCNYPIICGLHTMHFREKKPSTIPFYKSYYFSSRVHQYFTHKYSEGVKVFSLKPSLYKYFTFSYPSKDEQLKIVSFLRLIDKKIEIIENKINILKKYKKGIKNNALKYIDLNGKKIDFLKMFTEYKKINKNNFHQYTVGKNGLIKIDDINYDLSNHSVFLNNNLLIGIGIDEIAISIYDKGCVSPVYTVYSINNDNDNYYFYWFLKDLLIKQKRFITKKSTRREYEIDKKELKKCKIQYIMDAFIKFSISTLNIIDLKIGKYDKQLYSLKLLKLKLLKDIFI